MVQTLQRMTSTGTKGAAGLLISYTNAPGFLPAPNSLPVRVNENSLPKDSLFAVAPPLRPWSSSIKLTRNADRSSERPSLSEAHRSDARAMFLVVSGFN
jgi:hypothetical protein